MNHSRLFRRFGLGAAAVLLVVLFPGSVTAAGTHYFVVTAPGTAVSGSAHDLTVEAHLVAGGAVDPAYTGTVSFSSSDGNVAVALPGPYAFTGSGLDNGSHTFTNGLTLATVGNQTVTVTEPDTSTGTSSGTAVTAAAADHLVVSAPGTADVGTPISVTVTATDPYGNTDTGYIGNVGFTSTDLSAALPGNHTFDGTDLGVHAYTNGVTFAHVGSGTQTVTATDQPVGTINGTSGGITVSPGTPTLSWTSVPPGGVLVTDPGSTTVGASNYTPGASSPSPVAIVITLDGTSTGCTLVTGVVHFNSVGTCKIDANQTSNGNWNAAVQIQQTITISIGTVASFVVTTSGSPSLYGSSVTFTATVSGGGVTPTGTVQFKSDGSSIGSPVTLVSGVATYATSALSVADHLITAVYSGDTNYATSTSAAIHQVVSTGAAATTVVATSGTPVAYGSTVTFTATVSGVGVTPTGTVQFKSDGSNIGSPVSLVSGVATYATSALALGDHSITAVYSGDLNYAVSTSPVLHQVVTPGPATHLTVTGLGSPRTVGSAGNVTVTALDVYNNTATAYGGTVHFTSSDGVAILPANSTLSGGVGTFSVSLQTVGTQSVTATDTVTTSITGSQTGIVVTTPSPATYHALAPTRLLDSRSGSAFSSHVARAFQVTGGVVPAGATAVTGNLTVTGQTSRGFLYIGPIAMNNPTSSTLNFPTNDDRANAVTVALSGSGSLWVTYAASTLGPTAHVIFDVTGYFTPDDSGATYHPLTPARVLDSRDGTGGLSGTFSSHSARTFQVSGRGGVPANATAVTGNLTVTQQNSAGFLYLGPVPKNNPTSSTLNFPLSDDRANAVTVQLGAGGALSVTYAASTYGPTAHVIFDVTGYFTPDLTGARYVPLTPSRILDSRDGTGGLPGPFGSHVARTFTVTNHGGVPSNASAVTGNLTVTGQTSLGFLFIGPIAMNNPTSSTLNFPMNDDRANAVTVALGSGGTLSVTYAASTYGPTAYAIFDVTGYFVS